jgi:hypothetical protein
LETKSPKVRRAIVVAKQFLVGFCPFMLGMTLLIWLCGYVFGLSELYVDWPIRASGNSPYFVRINILSESGGTRVAWGKCVYTGPPATIETSQSFIPHIYAHQIQRRDEYPYANTYGESTFYRSGFDWLSYKEPTSVNRPLDQGLHWPDSSTYITTPDWFWALIWGTASTCSIIPIIRRRNRHDSDLCPTCSYDLRAHPLGSRCPECGATVSCKPPAVPAPKDSSADTASRPSYQNRPHFSKKK